ncbi:hypothetical protein [Streptomyces prasinus]|uniref:hypothetical protein n=1 Tax=Streptomyces prasinus TaxID=67345 RepID=UPI0033A6005A
MTTPFKEFLKYTKPGPARPCSDCGTYSLRLYTELGGEEEAVCTNVRCSGSPLYRPE